MAEQGHDEIKAVLRGRAHAQRAALSPEQRAEASLRVTALFFDEIAFSPDDAIAGYWSIRDEVDCQPILVRLVDAGHKVILPVVVGPDAPLDLRVWEADQPLYEAGFGTLAPSELAPRAVPDIVLMPLLGFDADGTRLGYGGGYYDRTLASLSGKPLVVGLAFAAQEVPAIPREDHDIPLDAVITEQGVRFFRERPGA